MTTNEYGCSHLERRQVTINHDSNNEFWVTSCEPHEWFGTIYTEPGDYEHHIPNMAGCDSLMVMHLELGDNYIMNDTVTTCDSYTWHGTTYTTSGDFNIEVENPDGCDSLFTLYLTIGHSAQGDFDKQVCEPMQWYEHWCDHDGDYVHTFSSPEGCDSIVTMHFTIGEALLHPAEVEQTCEPSFTWRGRTFTESGIYYDTVAGVAGCDEIYQLNLTMGGDVQEEKDATVCDRYPWPWVTDGYLTESGVYTHTIQTEQGCDSTIILKLTVNHTPQLTMHGPTWVNAATNVISGINNYWLSDSLDIAPNTVEWACSNPDWTVTPLGNRYRCRLWVSSIGHGILKATTNQGCDTVATIEINATWFDVEENDGLNVVMFPNPVNDKVTIQADELVRIRLVDAIGQVVLDKNYEKANATDLRIGQLPPGVYMVEITTKIGKTTRRLVVTR